MKSQYFALALLGLVVAAPSWAANTCSTTVEANDAMQFNTKAIEVPKTCKQFTVTLKHTGTLPKSVMGHNWVLTGAADQAGALTDGSAAGMASNYVKPNDSRVIAHTKIIGGGESDTATFKVAALKAGQPYVFFCSFPGHAALMKGTLSLAK